MDKHTLAASIRIGMFAERETIQEAFDYADQVFKSLGAADIAARTAMHVVLNTVAKQIAALPDPLAAPPAEVRISPEDNPAAGITDLETMIIRLIDARIAHQRTDPAGDIDVKIETAIDDFVDNRLDDKIEGWVEHNLDFADIVRDELRNNISFSIEVD